MAFTPTHRLLPAREECRDQHPEQDPDRERDTVSRDLRTSWVFRWLLSLSRILLWFFWVGVLDLLSGRWVNMGITVAAGTVGLLLRMGLGWLNGEPREDWFTDLPVVLLRILLCVLRPNRACAALGMSTGEEDAAEDADGAGETAGRRGTFHPDRRHQYRSRRGPSRSPVSPGRSRSISRTRWH